MSTTTRTTPRAAGRARSSVIQRTNPARDRAVHLHELGRRMRPHAAARRLRRPANRAVARALNAPAHHGSAREALVERPQPSDDGIVGAEGHHEPKGHARLLRAERPLEPAVRTVPRELAGARVGLNVDATARASARIAACPLLVILERRQDDVGAVEAPDLEVVLPLQIAVGRVVVIVLGREAIARRPRHELGAE